MASRRSTASFNRLADIGLGPTAAFRASPTRSSWRSRLPGSACVYWSGVRGMRTVRGAAARSRRWAAGFAHTLIPIGLAYLVAHYFSLFVFQEQAQFTYLLSDPLGDGETDLFGTAASGDRLRRSSAPTRSGTCRSGRWSSDT